MKTILRIIIFSFLFTTISIADIINVPADIDSIQGRIDLANPGDTLLNSYQVECHPVRHY